jgi:hypothetical protein
MPVPPIFTSPEGKAEIMQTYQAIFDENKILISNRGL